MKDKANLKQILRFYKKLDSTLGDYSGYRNNDNLPIAVGGDVAYLMILQHYPRKKDLGKFFKSCQEKIDEFEREVKIKKPGIKIKREDRFVDYNPYFSDVDIYLQDPINIISLQLALTSMGYYAPKRKTVENKGYITFLNKTEKPAKVEVFVRTKKNHFRPQSNRGIETIIPIVESDKENYTNFVDMENLLFIKPEAILKRLEMDIYAATEEMPYKMIQDFVIIEQYLKYR